MPARSKGILRPPLDYQILRESLERQTPQDPDGWLIHNLSPLVPVEIGS